MAAASHPENGHVMIVRRRNAYHLRVRRVAGDVEISSASETVVLGCRRRGVRGRDYHHDDVAVNAIAIAIDCDFGVDVGSHHHPFARSS